MWKKGFEQNGYTLAPTPRLRHISWAEAAMNICYGRVRPHQLRIAAGNSAGRVQTGGLDISVLNSVKNVNCQQSI